ncbi:MAG: 50S ribosomal protein L24 [Nitrospirales bacterium]|nr:MAG: 50S ribosomal protein L24 [Nitrospirales bacterium]
MSQGVRDRGKCRIKKGDTVMVIAGRDRGKIGKVLSVSIRAGRVMVEKINIVKRHTKPTQKNKQGGILEKEASMAISNVMPYCEALKKPSRTRMKILEDGRKIRVYQKAPDEPLDKN